MKHNINIFKRTVSIVLATVIILMPGAEILAETNNILESADHYQAVDLDSETVSDSEYLGEVTGEDELSSDITYGTSDDYDSVIPGSEPGDIPVNPESVIPYVDVGEITSEESENGEDHAEKIIPDVSDGDVLDAAASETVYILNGKTYDISDKSKFTVSTRDGLTTYAVEADSAAIITGTYTGTVAMDIDWYLPSLTRYICCDFSMGSCTTMSEMFNGWSDDTYKTEVVFGKHFDSSKVQNMSRMFYRCTSLRRVDFTNFSTSSTTDMSSMFIYCVSLSDCDLSGFDTSNVTNMEGMFNYCYRVPDVSSFNTSKVTNMASMFSYCLYTEELDLSSFDMSKVTYAFQFVDSSNNIKRIYTPKNVPKSFDKDYRWVWFTGGTYYDCDGKSYTALPTELSKSIFIKKGSRPSKEESKYYTPTEAKGKQSFWNLDASGKLESYTRNQRLLRDGVYNLAYYNETTGDVWFGSWCFDANGKVRTGDYNGRHYNDKTDNGYPYGIDMYETEQQQKEFTPSVYLGSYNYMQKYNNDLDTLCTLELSIFNFSKEFCAIVSGCFKSWGRAEFDIDKVIDEIAYQYMNDEVRCKDVLKTILEKRYDNSNAVTDFNSQTKRNLKPWKTTIGKLTDPMKKTISEEMKKDKKLLEAGKLDRSKYKADYYKVIEKSTESELAFDGVILEKFIGTTMTMLGDANDLILAFADHTDVENFLDEIAEVAPARSPLKQAAEDLKFEYDKQFYFALNNALFDAIDAANGWSKVLNGVEWLDFPDLPSLEFTGFLEQDLESNFIALVDFAFGTKFKTIEGLLDIVKSADRRYDATDNLVASVTMVENAMRALKTMEEKVFSGNGTPSYEDFSKYADMFYLAKAMKIYQYEQMLAFYESGHMRDRLIRENREFVNDFLIAEIAKIDSMTLDSYDVMASRNDLSEFIFEEDGYVSYMLQGNLLKNSWKKISGKMYYFDSNGHALTSMQPFFVTNEPAYTAEKGKYYKYYYFSEGDKTCGADNGPMGSRVHGLNMLDDRNWYYFDEDTGVMQKNCIVELMGRYAVIDKDGRCDIKVGKPPVTVGKQPPAQLEVKNNKSIHKFNCPIDVAAFDNSGIKLAEIVNDTVVLSGNSSVQALIDGDGQKIIVADRDAECNIKVTANADGKCSYSVSMYDENGDFESKIQYNDIPIVKDDVISSNKTSVVMSDETSGMDYYTVEKDDVIIADEYKSTLQYYSVTIDYGSGSTERVVECGDFAEISLDDELYPLYFEGWYIGDEKVSSEKTFRMQINENTVIEARTSEAPVPRVESFSLTVMEGLIGLNCYISGIPEEVIAGGKAKFGDCQFEIPQKETDGTYKFSITCSAKKMGESYLIGLFDSDNKLVELENANEDGMYRYSVRDYINEAKERPDELGRLAEAMDTYGLYAQNYFNYNVPENFPDVDAVDFSEYEKSISGTMPDGVKYYGSSLIVKDSITMRHYFEITGNAEDYTWSVQDTPVRPVESDGLYYIEIRNVSMRYLDYVNQVSVKKGSDEWIMAYSPYSYAFDATDKSGKSELINLMYSMYYYSVAAEEYYIKKYETPEE